MESEETDSEMSSGKSVSPILCKAAYLGVKKSIADDLLNKEELKTALQQAGFNPSQQFLKELWSENTAAVSYEQFCSICENPDLLVITKETLELILAKFNVVQDTPPTCRYLSHLLTTKGEKMKEEEVANVFESMGMDANSKLNTEKFSHQILSTTEICQKLYQQRLLEEEKKYKKNSSTYTIQKKGAKFRKKRSTEIECQPSDWQHWHQMYSRGCFFVEENANIICHQYILEISNKCDIWVRIQPKSMKENNPVDTLLFILKETEGASRQLIKFTENRDKEGTYYLQASLEVGKYHLVPFTTGCRLNLENVNFHDKGIKLLKRDERGIIALNSIFRQKLLEIFAMSDLDGSGTLSRKEFSLYNWRVTGEETRDEEWMAIEENFDMKNGELTSKGFLDLQQMEAEDSHGIDDDLWLTLRAMGYNTKLQQDKACPFLLEIYSSDESATLHVSGLKSGGIHLHKALCRSVVEKGSASKIKNMNDLLLYTYTSRYRGCIIVQNKSHSKIIIRLDCRESENCCSHRPSLDETVEVPPKSTVIGHHLMPAEDTEPWGFECTETLIQ